jgi:hypothetical protein
MRKDTESPGKGNNKLAKENSSAENSPRSESKRSLKSPEKQFFRRNKLKIGLSSRLDQAAEGPNLLPGKPIRPQADFALASAAYRRPILMVPQHLDIDIDSVDNLLALGEEHDEPANREANDNLVLPMDIDDGAGYNLPEINIVHQQVLPQAAADVHPIDIDRYAVANSPVVDIVQQQAQPAVVANVGEVLHFSTYAERNNPCPAFLEHPQKRGHKTIFTLLYTQGQRFLCADVNNERYWGKNPSHHQIVIQPQHEPRSQFYLSMGPADVKYPGTWVSAIVKTNDNQFYPLHIITKNTLGAVKTVVRYPNSIRDLFPAAQFPNCWPHGLAKECLIICADTPEQKRQLMKDYETFVTTVVSTKGELIANKEIPNFIVYCKGELSKLMTVQNSTQQTMAKFIIPDLRPFTAKQTQLLQIEIREVAARRGEIALQAFETVCSQFYSPAPLSHEIALTHFSLTQLRNFSGVLTQSRNRMIDLKAKLYAQYKGPQMKVPQLQNFDRAISNSIYDRSNIITKLENLAMRYIEYSTQLSNLFKLAPAPSIEDIEPIIYRKIQDLILTNNYDNVGFQERFSSGRALISWMLTREIRIPADNIESLADAIAEQMPRPEAEAIRVF